MRNGDVMLLLGVALVSVGAIQQQQPAPGVVFDRVTVVDVERGTLVPAQRVVVAGNRIQAVGPSSAVRTPKGALVVDAQGKYLMPGLWDMHVHPRWLTTAYFPIFVAYGVTGIRDASSSEPLDSILRWRGEILAGTRIGPPRQLFTGPAIEGAGDTPEGAAHIVDSLAAAGANFLKTRPFNFPLAAAARRVGLPFGGHVNDPFTAWDAADSGIRIIDHTNTSGGISERCWGPSATVERCQPLAEHLQQRGTWFVPTLVVEHFGLGEPMPHAAGVAARYQARFFQLWGDSTTLAGAPDTASSPTPGFMTVMRQIDFPLLAGTDMGWAGMFLAPGLSLQTELEIYVAEGMTPAQALRAGTLNPAKLLGATDSLGTVATGKLADLVLLDADPLADIANIEQIEAVVANGRYFDRAALAQVLADARARVDMYKHAWETLTHPPSVASP